MRRAAVGLVAALCMGGAVLAQGSGAGRQGGAGRGGGGTTILEQAPTDRAIAIPKEKLNQYLKDMDAKKLQTLRMIEGGKYNVNIRRITGARDHNLEEKPDKIRTRAPHHPPESPAWQQPRKLPGRGLGATGAGGWRPI